MKSNNRMMDENIVRQKFSEIWLPFYQKFVSTSGFLQRKRLLQEWNIGLEKISDKKIPWWVEILSVRQRSEMVGENLVNLLIPSLGLMNTALQMSETRFRLAQIAVVLEQFRRQKGRYPENQEEVTPMLSEHGLDWYDPFTEKQTLVYRLNPQSQKEWQEEYNRKCEILMQGKDLEEDDFLFHEPFLFWKPYLLYSFGSNQKDDGGIPFSSDGERRDEVF